MIVFPPVTVTGFAHPYAVWFTRISDAAVILIFAVPAVGDVAVTDPPVKLSIWVPSTVPTGVPSSWIVIPPIAGDPPPVIDFQVQPPEPFAVRTKLLVPVPPLVSCIPIGFILSTVNKSVPAL